MINPEFFNAKILLFGEYGMIFNAMALSVPFTKFSGRLDFSSNESDRQSSEEIRKFYEYLKGKPVNRKLNFPFGLEKMGNDIINGLYFKSSIPQQYGVGSSGALVAALFSKYTIHSIPENQPVPELLKADFALLESYFHGKSSGMDPLISFLNQPLLIDSGNNVQKVNFDLNESGLAISLVDTKTTGATGPLVQHFLDQYYSIEFKNTVDSWLIPINNTCIESLLNSDKKAFFNALEKLIHFQLEYFRRMIPENFHSIIQEALEEKVFIKLLGSGGGGFLIAFAESPNVMEKWKEKKSIDLLKVV